MAERVEVSIWNEANVAKLIEWWPTRSSGWLAKEFGVTRNAIIGKVTRLGLKKGHEQKRERIAAARLGKRRDPVFRLPNLKAEASLDASKDVLDEPFIGIFITELNSAHCRYVKDSASLLFCGHEKKKGSSYCPNHHKHIFMEAKRGS